MRLACENYLTKRGLADELQGLEERLAASVLRSQKEVARVGEDAQLLIALFDQLA